ncbi:putative glycosyltransferase [Acorus calamus]|uniref:Glycosyltransferase n=1 Tax=Acorus calamus TaxID=4465 RepID=A0AAV9FCD7_ACOCL|nr:putative glycosyltransferase [Acorus calamus]
MEKSLARARAAIRRAAMNKNYTSNRKQSFIPRGAIYRNAYAFHQSHIEMEKRLKIWAYREGEPPLVHSGPHGSIYSLEGHFISEMESGKSRFAARRPEEANVFFLPYSIVNVVRYVFKPATPSLHKQPVQWFALDYARTVSNKHPFWNRSEGADHFMVSCHDWGPQVSHGDRDYFRNFIRVLCNANTSEGFIPKRDASMPEINLKDKRIAPPDRVTSPAKRTRLAFFAGGLHGPIRPSLLRHWKDRDEDVVVYEHMPSGSKGGGGDICGCVPVIISEAYALPFEDVLDWGKFTVEVPVERIPDLKEILQGISTRRYLTLHRRVLQAQKHFVINRPAKGFDVIHMMLHSVWLRRLNLRLSY